MNQKHISIGFILAGLIFAGANFFLFNQLYNGGFQFDLKGLLKSDRGSANVSSVLPDIKPGESFTNSKVRDEEIGKIKNSLPFSSDRFDIDYNPTSKYLTVTIKADTIDQYRENKFLAEEKLYEFGTEEICILQVIWAVPLDLRSSVEKHDLITRSCTL